jgi:hypothetical protein
MRRLHRLLSLVFDCFMIPYLFFLLGCVYLLSFFFFFLFFSKHDRHVTVAVLYIPVFLAFYTAWRVMDWEFGWLLNYVWHD